MKVDLHKHHRQLFAVILGGYLTLTVVIAARPALWVNAHTEPLPGSRALTSDEEQGLGVYASEGCVYCHTQQVRPLAQDQAFGRPSVAADYARLAWRDVWREPAAVLGSQRTGPDVSDVGARQPSATWQYIHLYAPRAVVPWSVMPAFPWLFRLEEQPGDDAVVVPVPARYAPPGVKVVATPRARALVAYLLSLKQPPLPGATGTGAPGVAAASLGSSLYATRCATCHQTDGRGVPGAFPPLVGDPAVTAQDGLEHIRVVLFGMAGVEIEGVAYPGEMPAWPQLSDDEVAAVVNYERSSWGNRAPAVTPAEVAAVRRQGPGPHP